MIEHMQTRPKATIVLRFATRTCGGFAFETRRHDTRPKSTTVLRFATRTPLIPVIVGTFETRRHDSRPESTTVLRFATRTCGDTRERFATTVLRFATRTCGDTPATHANALQTLANACEHRGGDTWTRALWSSPLAGRIRNTAEATPGRVPCGVPP